jgi:hypothetical protein
MISPWSRSASAAASSGPRLPLVHEVRPDNARHHVVGSRRAGRHDRGPRLEADRLLGLGLEDQPLPALVRRRLLRCQETGAHVGAGGAEGERRGEAAAVGYSAGREHGDRRDRVDHLRDEGDCAHAGCHTLATRLGALRYQDVDAELGGLAGLSDRVDLVDDLGPGGVRSLDERARVAKGEGDRGRLYLERCLEGVLVQGWDDVVDNERPGGECADPVDLREQTVACAEDRGKRADRSGLRNGGDQLGRAGRPDRSLQNRGLDVEQLTEGGADDRLLGSGTGLGYAASSRRAFSRGPKNADVESPRSKSDQLAPSASVRSMRSKLPRLPPRLSTK